MARMLLDRSDVVLALAGVFRRRGFEASSLSVIQQETGIGRGSLYHFFPEGKTDMARAVLAEVRRWFDEHVVAPLRSVDTADAAAAALPTVFQETVDYFTSRASVCLFAAVTLGDEQATFAAEVRAYFVDWVDALAAALRTGGVPASEAIVLATDAVAAVQGGLVLARAYDDTAVLTGVVTRSERRLLDALP